MLGISRFLAAHAFKFVVHPVTHMKNQVGDGVRGPADATIGELGIEIFDTCDRIDVCTLTVEEFC